jgi:hypothetical protein
MEAMDETHGKHDRQAAEALAGAVRAAVERQLDALRVQLLEAIAPAAAVYAGFAADRAAGFTEEDAAAATLAELRPDPWLAGRTAQLLADAGAPWTTDRGDAVNALDVAEDAVLYAALRAVPTEEGAR